MQPGAKRTEIAGFYRNCLKLKINAPPTEGQANKDLLKFLAARLNQAPSKLAIVKGQTSREKLIKIEGITLEEIAKKLQL